jgi:hypothetical protein
MHVIIFNRSLSFRPAENDQRFRLLQYILILIKQIPDSIFNESLLNEAVSKVILTAKHTKLAQRAQSQIPIN